MRFEPGNKLAKGGKRKGAGRPPKYAPLIQQTASEIARAFIEQHVTPVLDTYLALAAGQVVERPTTNGKKKFALSVDPATTRHYVDKILPDTDGKEPSSGNTFIQFVFGASDGERHSIDVGLHNGNRNGVHAGRLHIGSNGGKG